MSNTPADCTVTLSNPKVRGDRRTNLWVEHPDWAMRSHRNDTIYCLPFEAIDRLAFRDGNARAFLDPDQAATEREFTKLCKDNYAIGTNAEEFIIGTPLNVRPEYSNLASLSVGNVFPWFEKACASISTYSEKTDSPAEQTKGYTGWLLTEPEFLLDVDRLRALWMKLPARLRPHFPMYRPGRAVEHPLLRPFDPKVSGVRAQAFGEALLRLLNRWGLMSMATWDLPAPQGPLFPNLLPMNCLAQPRSGANVHVPTFFSVGTGSELAAEVFRVQWQAARDLGLDYTVVGMPRHGAYARLLDILHLERSIRSRFHSPAGPRGLVDCIVETAAVCIGIEKNRVCKYRKAITRCRRGDRSSVTMLRVTATARRPG